MDSEYRCKIIKIINQITGKGTRCFDTDTCPVHWHVKASLVGFYKLLNLFSRQLHLILPQFFPTQK